MNETKKRWVLVVDDSPTLCEQLSTFLKKRGYICHTANDAYQALTAVEKYQFDMVFLDVVMPGMDGFTACRKIKAIPSYRQVPVILLTGLDSAADRVHGMMAGCACYLTKPFTYNELDELVMNLCVPRRAGGACDPLPPVPGHL